MASFYPQLLSNKSLSHQWQQYLQDTPLINNIEDIVQNQTKEYQNIIERSSNQQAQAIQESTEAVCGTLSSGFSLLSNNLRDVSFELGEVRSELNIMSSMLDWHLSLIIEQHRISNLLLGNIALLLRIPDIQKERQYYIEQGIKFLKNAFLDNDFYEDSLTNLLKAEIIEPTDFFVLHRIGLIYMYSPNHVDLSKAEEYFRKAAKYAVAEATVGATLTPNILASDTQSDLLAQAPTLDSIKIQTAESYLFAARCCYIQGKFMEAAELAGKSFDLIPNMVEAGFLKAKSLSCDNKITQAVSVLKSVIKKDRYYSIKVVSDIDLFPKPEIMSTLKEFQLEAFNEASSLLYECKNNMISDSIAKDEISKIEILVNNKSFLHCKKAIDLINKKEIRKFSNIFQSSKSKSYSEEKNLTESIRSLKAVRYKVKHPNKHVSAVKNLFDYLTNSTQCDFPRSQVSSDLMFPNTYESKNMNSTVLNFLIKEKEYFNNLPKVKTHIDKVILEINDQDLKQRDYDVKKSQKELVKIQGEKNSRSLQYGTKYLLWGAGIGTFLGVFIAFFRSCNYNANSKELFQAGVFLPTWLVVIIIGAVIGAFIGYLKGQNE